MKGFGACLLCGSFETLGTQTSSLPRCSCSRLLPPLHAGLLVFADWYHLDTIHKLRFFDDNTRSWWDAATGGHSWSLAAARSAIRWLAISPV